MKQILLTITTLFIITLCKAQEKLEFPPHKDTITMQDTSTIYNLQLKSTVDTVKVRFVVFGEKNQILWLDGFALRLFLIETKSKKPVDANPARIMFFNKLWQQIDDEIIIRELTKPLNWK